MSETLGSLCDKLTIVKLKQWHSEDSERLASLSKQEFQLKEEIDDFVAAATCGEIHYDKLTFAANKVYKKEGNATEKVEGNIGKVFSKLAMVNCELWHEQEKVYEFEKVPVEEKNSVVKQLALLNLQRNQCIDQIDRQLSTFIKNFQTNE